MATIKAKIKGQRSSAVSLHRYFPKYYSLYSLSTTNSAPEAEKIFKDWGENNQFRMSLARFVPVALSFPDNLSAVPS